MSAVREGTIIGGKYRIERPLARGGMGAIWVARHLQLDMPVAVKFMDANFAAMPEGRTRFEREAKAVALIQSPNIIHIHDYGIHEDLPYIAMELLRGEDLGARIRREGRLSMRAVSDVIVQVCKALRKAHEAGIIHRDLKPANIFLARDDDEQIVKVLDFGVAKMVGMGEASDATRTGVVVGSVHYMSPEQARGHKDIDPRSDLWSVGVIAFRALAGQLPFPGDQMGDVIVKICSDPLPSITALRPDLGPEVEGFFARALARKPDERFQNARELAQAFAALPGSMGEVSSGSTALRPSLPSMMTASTPMPGSSREVVSRTSPSNVAAPLSSGTPFSMGPPLSDPPATPAVAPLYALPPPPSTLTSASQVSDILAPEKTRGSSKRTAVLVGVAAVSLVAAGAFFLAGRGGASRPAGTPTVEPPAVTAAAPAPTVSAIASASAAPSASASSSSAPAPASASAARTAAAKTTAAPRGTAPPKINSELGF